MLISERNITGSDYKKNDYAFGKYRFVFHKVHIDKSGSLAERVVH